jgi:flagellar secretion chaperone FliS
MDDARARFLQDRVLTATPGQRVVMLFDRLVLDLTRAGLVESSEIRQHTGHASQIVAELFGSLDPNAGGPVENLSAIYSYLLTELMNVNPAQLAAKLPGMLEIVTALRATWVVAVDQVDHPERAGQPADSGVTANNSAIRALAGSWVG